MSNIMWCSDTESYIAKEKICNGQTVVIGLELVEKTIDSNYWNIYASVYNKRKHSDINEDSCKITSKNPFLTASIGIRLFKSLINVLLDDKKFTNNKSNIVYCTWTDNKRRDVYYKYLNKYGYQYGNLFGEKIIYKKYGANEVIS